MWGKANSVPDSQSTPPPPVQGQHHIWFLHTTITPRPTLPPGPSCETRLKLYPIPAPLHYTPSHLIPPSLCPCIYIHPTLSTNTVPGPHPVSMYLRYFVGQATLHLCTRDPQVLRVGQGQHCTLSMSHYHTSTQVPHVRRGQHHTWFLQPQSLHS